MVCLGMESWRGVYMCFLGGLLEAEEVYESCIFRALKGT